MKYQGADRLSLRREILDSGMPQLWLVPVDEPSYQQTLAEPVDITDAPDKPEAFPDEARIWGVRTDPAQGFWERNRRNLEPMEVGDPLLIYRNSQSTYTAAGRVGGPLWHREWVHDEFRNTVRTLILNYISQCEWLRLIGTRLSV